MWLVVADRFWDLEKTYRGQEIADRIAWEASQQSLPGECEGYPPCTAYAIRVMEGEYLERYPKGDHALDALDQIVEAVEYLATADPDLVWDADIPAEELREMVEHLKQL